MAGVSAILLFAFTFLDWFGTTTSEDEAFQPISVSQTAWDALDYIPVFLLVSVVTALVPVPLRLAGVARTPSGPFSSKEPSFGQPQDGPM